MNIEDAGRDDLVVEVLRLREANYALRVAVVSDLRLAEERFRTIFDASPLGIAMSRNGVQLFANPAYARLFGYPGVADVVGTRLVDQLSPEVHEDIVRTNQAREASEPQPSSYETVGRRQDGTTFPFLVDVSYIQLPDGPATLAFFRDLSEKHQAEAHRAKMEAQLRQSQKLEAIGTLAGGIAHDFNNILTPILAHAELALAQLPTHGDLHDDLEQVVVAAGRASDLVGQILAISRREEHTMPVVIDVGALVNEAVKFLRASFPATIEIQATIDPACGAVLGDPSQLHQVLLNLCTNARSALGARPGRLDISVERT
ncbi:MAG: PAS domain S-box protein, partial [Deltaproteobacteria bacterium]